MSICVMARCCKRVLPFTAAQFARGIIMPNLVPPVTTVAAASAYRDRILAARGEGSDFQPLMTCYLTDTTAPDEIEKGFARARLGRSQAFIPPVRRPMRITA